MSSSETQTFSFQTQQLCQQLSQQGRTMFTGYCHLVLDPVPSTPSQQPELHWYLAFSQGKVVFLAEQKLDWPVLIRTLERFIPRLRTSKSKLVLQTLETRSTHEQRAVLGNLINVMERMGLLRPSEALQVIRQSILVHLDVHLYSRSGQARFTADPQLVTLAPIRGFDLQGLLNDCRTRQEQWQRLQNSIPSLTGIPVLNPEVLARYSLSPEQRQRLERMTRDHQSLFEIAVELAKDPLEVAQVFQRWIQKDLVKLQVDQRTLPQSYTLVAVDDSPAMQTLIRRTLPQFQVYTTGSAAEGLSLIFRHQPDLIVLDLTMPEIDGLEICRTIREMPQFKQTPIVILTARDGLMDKLKGRLVGANSYLTKPFEAESFKRAVFQHLHISTDAQTLTSR